MNKTERERAYRLLMYPVVEALKCGAITKDEFKERHKEVVQQVLEEDHHD